MTGARKMLLATILSMGLAACAQTDNRALSESALANTGENVTWQSLNDEVSGVKASQLTDLINLDDIAHTSSFIEEALQHNANLQQTLITLQKAQVAIDSTASQRNINVDAGVSATKNKQSDTNYTSSLNVSWELDVWQKISDGITAASLNADSAKASYQSARDTLVANVIRRYIDILSQQQLLSIEKARLEVLENNEAVILTRYRTGLGDLDDLDAAKTSSASTRATIAAYKYNVTAAKRTLAVLLGRQDQSLPEIDTAFHYPDVLIPLTSLPKQDLARRPDLQSAYLAIQASQYDVDVAYKALLPSINVSAALTNSNAGAAETLFTNPLYTMLGQITAPIFQGGALRAQIDDAKLTSLNTWWQYQETLLNAVQETQNALDNERALEEQINHVEIAIFNAKRSEENMIGKYRQGLADILDLLAVYNTRYDLQAQLTQLNASQLQNRIDLGLALGLGVSQ